MQFVLHIWLLRNFYCGEAHHANYGKHSCNHHFQHCAQSVYQIESVLKLFETAVCFAHFCFSEISTPVVRIMLTMANIVLIIISNIAHTLYIRFKAFSNFSKLLFVFTFWLLRKFYCGDAHHAIYGKQSLNHHLQHCAHSVFQIDSVLKLLEITVCFTHFGFYEISTPVVRIMLTMANIVLIIISNIAHTVYIRLKAVWNFSKLEFVLQSLAFTKFLLWWCASC